MPNEQICATCRHWHMVTGCQVGTCRRYPPVLDPDDVAPDGAHVWIRPTTAYDDTCGEYTPSPT